MIRWFFVGLVVASVGALAWVVPVLGGSDTPARIGIFAVILGLGTAAAGSWLGQGSSVGVGFVCASLGIAEFYHFSVLQGPPSVAGLVFVVGTLGTALGTFASKTWAVRSGLAVAAAGSLVWVYADLGSLAWEPGDVLVAVGLGMAAVRPGIG